MKWDNNICSLFSFFIKTSPVTVLYPLNPSLELFNHNPQVEPCPGQAAAEPSASAF